MALEKSRRRILKAAGIGIAGGLAGCSGGGDGGDGGGDGGDGGDGGGDGGDGGDGSGDGGDSMDGGSTASPNKKQLDGVTVEWWDWLNIQGKTIKQGLTQTAKQFEQDTGATVKINFSGWEETGTKWPQAIQQGNVPHIFDQETGQSNATPRKYWYVHDNLVKDFSSSYGNMNWDAFSGTIEAGKREAKGWPDIDVITVQQWQLPRTIMLWRTDYVEEAGVSDSFPPSNTEELIEVARAVQENTNAQAGFAPPGQESNYWFHPRAAHVNAKKSEVFNSDFTDLKVNNDAWTEGFRDAKKFAESGVTPPNTVSLTDEKTLALTGQGQYGGTVTDMLGHSLLLEQTPDVVKNGNIEWVPWSGWPSEQGDQAKIWLNGNTIIKDPDDRSDQRKRRESAAVQWLTDYWMEKGYQERMPSLYGSSLMPTRSDAFEGARGNVEAESQHHWAQSGFEALSNSATPYMNWGSPDVSWTAGTAPAIPNWQAVYKGEMAPEEATQDWYDTITSEMGL